MTSVLQNILVFLLSVVLYDWIVQYTFTSPLMYYFMGLLIAHVICCSVTDISISQKLIEPLEDDEFELEKRLLRWVAPVDDVDEDNVSDTDEDGSHSESWESNNSETDESDASDASDHLISSGYKMVLVVRADLKIRKGKLAAQCSHATVKSYKVALKQTDEVDTLESWEYSGQANVTVKCKDEAQLIALSNLAAILRIPFSLVEDTVMAVGPAPGDIVDKVTGHLEFL